MKYMNSLTKERFRKRVLAGADVGELCREFGIRAKSAERMMQWALGVVAEPAEIGRRELGPMPEGEAEEPETSVFTLNVDVEAERLDDLLSTLTDVEMRNAVMEMGGQEKAYVFQLALHQRLNPKETLDAEAGNEPA